MDPSQSKKRKREDYEDCNVTLSASTEISRTGPVVVSFPGIQPPQKTAFKCYGNPEKSSLDSSGQILKSIIAGETDTVEFQTESFDEQGLSTSPYLIGIRDKTTNKVVLRQAPLHILARNVKAFKSLDPHATSFVNHERAQARNALGQAFGSKKAQQAIRALERNRVDVSAMAGVANILQDSIEVATMTLPTKEEAKNAAEESRPIPRYNSHAETPDQVYALHDIIPQTEFNAISVNRMMNAQNDNARLACLPYQRSSWLQQHVQAEFSSTKLNKSNLKILFYISCLLLFRSGPIRDKAQLQKRMSTVPGEVIDGLLERFTESNRDASKIQVTKQSETRLITYMFALCLRVDRYATDPATLVNDLSMSVQDITKYFKQLGCKFDVLSSAERIQLGLGPATEQERKFCVLRIPLAFPQQRTRKRR